MAYGLLLRPPRCWHVIGLAVLLAVLGASHRAFAADDGVRTRTLFATVYADQFAQTNLYSLPLDVVTGDLKTSRAYYVGGALSYALFPSFNVPLPFCGGCGVNGFSLETEGQLGRHFGLQDHFEGDITLLLRSPELRLPAGFSINAAVGEGASYAFELPKYEGSVAAEGPEAAGPRHFLNYLAFETEVSQAALPGWHAVLNVHHRSGIWGVIAPHKTGANYVGGGLRYDFW